MTSPNQSLALVTLVVRDYDEAINFYTRVLGFELIEDTDLPEASKRWVVVAPPGGNGARILLARAADAGQGETIGNQTGGRVAFILLTDDFWRDHEAYGARGVEFMGAPRTEAYGTVAVFRDLYGNLWDLLQPASTPQ